MKTILKIIAKIIAFPFWILITCFAFLVWVGICNDYEIWHETFIKNYFSLK